MRVTTRKSLRDLKRSRSQVIAVSITIMLGVMIYVATAGAFQNLTLSYHHTYDRLDFATYLATGGTPADVANAASGAGAETVITRAQYDPPMLLDDTKLLGRVIGMPTDGHPAVDSIAITDGSYFDKDSTDEAILETHAADTFGLRPGDTAKVYAADGWHEVTIVGVAESAEYLWPARSRQDVLGDPHSFAVLYLPADTVKEWYGPDNQALVIMPEQLTTSHSNPVTDAMTGAGATAIQTWEDQPSNATLNEDLEGFDEMSKAFPALFLLAAAVAAYVMLARRTLMERPIIGTLMAAGARRGRILRMYLIQGLVVGAIGAVAGVILGAAANGAVTSAYTAGLGIPDTIVENYPWMIVTGLLFGIVVGAVGAFFPALSASRTAPAAAMHTVAPSRPPGPWSRAVARMRWLPVPTRMALRDVARSPRRTFATMLGAILSLVLVLTAVGMMTSIVQAIQAQYTDIETQDATVVLEDGVDANATVGAVEGVETVEHTVVGQVTLRANGKSYVTTLRGFEQDTVMHVFRSSDGGTMTLPTSGILAGEPIADLLGVTVGDSVTVSTSDGDTTATIKGFVDEPVGTFAYATNETAAAIVPDVGAQAYDLAFADGVDRDSMRTTISQLDGVVSYDDAKATLDSLQQYLGLFWAFIGVMIALGGALALAVMYVTLAVNILERTGELATLRASGVLVRKVAGTITTENIVATALGIPIGLVLGTLASAAFLSTFSSDLFALNLTWAWWVPVAAALGVLVAAALSRFPAARAVKKVDVARVVRERAV
jgi:putative ABC transport system permease protein